MTIILRAYPKRGLTLKWKIGDTAARGRRYEPINAKITSIDTVPSWAQWRGKDRDGISQETGLLKVWPAGGPLVDRQAGGLGGGYLRDQDEMICYDIRP